MQKHIWHSAVATGAEKKGKYAAKLGGSIKRQRHGKENEENMAIRMWFNCLLHIKASNTVKYVLQSLLKITSVSNNEDVKPCHTTAHDCQTTS